MLLLTLFGNVYNIRKTKSKVVILKNKIAFFGFIFTYKLFLFSNLILVKKY